MRRYPSIWDILPAGTRWHRRVNHPVRHKQSQAHMDWRKQRIRYRLMTQDYTPVLERLRDKPVKPRVRYKLHRIRLGWFRHRTVHHLKHLPHGEYWL